MLIWAPETSSTEVINLQIIVAQKGTIWWRLLDMDLINVMVYILKAGCSAFQFNAGYNKQVFSPKSWKILVQIRLIVFEKTQKHTLFPKNDVTESKARLL